MLWLRSTYSAAGGVLVAHQNGEEVEVWTSLYHEQPFRLLGESELDEYSGQLYTIEFWDGTQFDALECDIFSKEFSDSYTEYGL